MLNAPWVAGKAGPDEFDCWGVVEYIYKLLGREHSLVFDFDRSDYHLVGMCMQIQAQDKKDFIVDDPKEFDIVMMYEKERPTHVGLYIDGQILHSLDPKNRMIGGVRLHNLYAVRKMFKKLEFYRLP